MAQFHQTSVATPRTIPLLQQRKYIPPGIRLRLKYDGTRADTRFRLPAKRTSQLKSAGTSVQSITGSRGVRISGSNERHHVPRHPLHSPVSSPLPLTCITVCHHISTGLYFPSFYAFDGASEFSVILEYCATSLDDSAFDLRTLKATALSRKPGANHLVMRCNIPQARRPQAIL